MSLHPGTGIVTLERVGPSHLVEVFGFLDRDPVANVYLLALTMRDGLAQPRDEVWVARREGDLHGVLYLGGQSGAILPVGEDPEVVRALAAQAQARLAFLPRRFQVIGPHAAVQAVVARFARAGRTPRLARDQIYMALERDQLAGFERVQVLRKAVPDDFDIVFETGCRLRAEELDEDPRDVDPLAYRRRVQEECREGSTSLWIDDQGLCFRVSVSALTPDAAQIAGVYTPPERRNRGFARQGLSELCARLFRNCRTACLFVNDFNAPALAVYRGIGFRDRLAWASAFYDEPR